MDIKSMKPKIHSAYRQGYYIPHNPQKYKGNPNNIIYRSSWELAFMRWCDGRADVLEWGSELISISYLYSLDGKYHQYFPDFYLKMKEGDKEQIYLVEVKPEKDLHKPEEPKSKTAKALQQYKRGLEVFIKNSDKLKALKKVCSSRGYKIMIVTEKSKLF